MLIVERILFRIKCSFTLTATSYSQLIVRPAEKSPDPRRTIEGESSYCLGVIITGKSFTIGRLRKGNPEVRFLASYQQKSR
jgi:hypothetical protein